MSGLAGHAVLYFQTRKLNCRLKEIKETQWISGPFATRKQAAAFGGKFSEVRRIPHDPNSVCVCRLRRQWDRVEFTSRLCRSTTPLTIKHHDASRMEAGGVTKKWRGGGAG
ncbi:hypothetical protein XELAEV_18020385mg [Xenopus laevis]|uniref:Uncharacterized protein n=1 Tax=Xenopus laevis TaxID=8355 RepID=A0A974D994_XENLA|nr:hypothetical protein XELAEV_18020385mg [Xenopus laevis]